MRKLIGIFCVVLGIACLFSAAGIVLFNLWEDKNAESISLSMLEEVHHAIGKGTEKDDTEDEISTDAIFADTPIQMITVEVEGYECIGILSIPAIELELPVLTDWSYEKLKKAPCLYFGSYLEKDFVIAAHNYTSHFGRLSALQAGDVVIFTDATGKARYYEVVLLETLPENATEEMISAGFDLSLYTCTLGGDNRVTVRCNTVELDR